MKRLKKEYKGLLLSNGNVKQFNTNDITDDMILYYEKQGFAHLFEEICDECKYVICICEKDVYAQIRKYKSKKK